MSSDTNRLVFEERRLPARQRAVLAGLGNGKQRKEIADELNIAPGTVQVHCNLLFAKLGIHNSREAARIAVLAGLAG